MSADIYQVQPGAYQQLTGAALPDGALIRNLDLTNGVWVSSTPPCLPGVNGTLLGPLASYNWVGKIGQNKQLYACVDTGVIVPVSIQVTDDGNTLNDPVGVSIAVSQRGAPNVLVGEVVEAALVNGGPFDISSYASLMIGLNAGQPGSPSGIPEQCSVRIRQYFAINTDGFTGGQITYDKIFSMNTLRPGPFVLPPYAGQLDLALPVRGPLMRVDSVAVGGAPAVHTGIGVYGTNRPVDDDTVTNNEFTCIVNAGLATGVTRNLPVSGDNTSTPDSFICSGKGFATISMIGAPASPNVNFYVSTIDSNGNINDILITNFRAINTPVQFPLPRGLVSFSANVIASAGTYTWSISVSD